MAKQPTTDELWQKILSNARGSRWGTTSNTVPEKPEAAVMQRRTEPGGRRTNGIRITNRLEAPAISYQKLRELGEPAPPEFITRHIECHYLDNALSGYFRFGTTTSYRADEASKNIGRLGDATEGRHQVVFDSPDRSPNVQLGGVHIDGNTMMQVDDPLVLEWTINDLCSCSSIGRFDRARAENIRNHDNGKLSAYVTYDLKKLINVIMAILKEIPAHATKAALLKKVQYGHKDVVWHIPSGNVHTPVLDKLEQWLDASFIKPHAFIHEEEIRFLLVEPTSPGGLLGNDILELLDERITTAIVDSGRF